MSQEDPNLPPQLANALRGAFKQHVDVPGPIDATLFFAARRKFDSPRRLRLAIGWGAGVAAAVAACVMVVLMLIPDKTPSAPPLVAAPQSRTAVSGDLDHNGKLDIVDAMLLARHLNDKTSAQPAWDFTGDGKVDDADVQAIAAAAVRLGPTAVAQQGALVGKLPSFDEARMTLRPALPPPARDFAMHSPSLEGLQ